MGDWATVGGSLAVVVDDVSTSAVEIWALPPPHPSPAALRCEGGGKSVAGAAVVVVSPAFSFCAASSSSRYCTNASSRFGAWYCATSSAGVPIASTRPWCMKEMRSQRAASFMKWVVTKMVILSSRDIRSRCRQNISRAAGSTPDVGSSSISTSGRCRQAAASCKRWRMPSGNAAGLVSATSFRSNCARASAIAALPRAPRR